ncbi:MAG TPA: hypothetical protein GXX51_10485 [Firmicutes bacterium]|nr:hypothetical protein [Bacillota bacterium]
MRRIKQVLKVGLLTFFLSMSMNLISRILLARVGLVLSFLILFIIVLIGIVFDIIGTAAAAASEKPFHAMAANKIYGAREALRVVRNADKVANFCNDVIGDISGTVSGAVGASIVFRLIVSRSATNDVIAGVLMTGLIAAITVGGKAFSKELAINEANRVILWVGEALRWFQGLTGITILGDKKGRNSSKGTRSRRGKRES